MRHSEAPKASWQLFEDEREIWKIRYTVCFRRQSIKNRNNEAYYREHLADHSHTACFAVETGTERILGCGGICYQKEMPSPDNLTGTNGYLMNIYTLPEVRSEGIGRKIIEYLISDAKERGTEKIFLESSGVAKKLYHEIGFADMEDYMKLEDQQYADQRN